jgi:acyl-CoA reductase-like NAD-dependent aldehyde dehydrogenase
MTPALLDESLDALLEPVTAAALKSVAANLPRTDRLFGFLMPGNVPGAGIHEVCAALLAGAGLIIKSASSEPLFFANFMRTLAEVDATVAARVAVVNFGRGDDAAMRELWAACDGGVVAYGDDASIAALSAAAAACASRRTLAGFGSRLSGALVVPGASPSAAASAADGLARDVTLFEQRGCLSPHHVFVVGDAGEARGFAARLARALERLARRLPAPARLPLDAAAAIRALRERARWRALAGRLASARGHDVALWEGERVIPAPGETPGAGMTESMTKFMTWTVIYDGTADFSAAPGYRTVFVSALKSGDELGERLGAAAGRLEAFALSAPPDVRDRLDAGLRRLGVTYVGEPGRMQSPPLDWLHGGGAMLELLRGAA